MQHISNVYIFFLNLRNKINKGTYTKHVSSHIINYQHV